MKEDISLQYIPQELKMNGLWCCWKKTPKGKVPFNVMTDSFAKSNDSSTFVSYPIVLHHLERYIEYDDDNSMIGGLGLGIFKGFSAVDIDHCVDEHGVISDMAQDIIDYINSYTEFSPSRHGIRIIFKTNVKIDKTKYYINNAKIGLEIYISDNTNKFVTMTGNHLESTPTEISDCDITYVLDKYMKKKTIISSERPMSTTTHYVDDNVLERALNNDNKLYSLWHSQATGAHGNENQTDEALCCKLAFYFKGDFNKIDDAFVSSPYFASKDEDHKNKWLKRKDYRLRTINNAINMISLSTNDFTLNEPKKPKYALNDTGNAHRFIDRFGDKIRYNVENKRWVIYNGKYWQDDKENNIKNFAEIMAEEMLMEANNETDLQKKQDKIKNVSRLYNVAGKENMLKEAQHINGIPVINDDFDSDPYILCCNNGVVNLRTGEVMKHSPMFMCSQTTGNDIDFSKEPVLFNKFMATTYENDKEMIDYVLKIFGYGLTGTTREQSMFQFFGEGKNGKSLLIELMSRAVGTYGATSKPSLICEDKWGKGAEPSELASLKGKRLVFVEEPKSTDKADESVIKNLTSGLGKIRACFKYANPFEFTFIGKLIVATNYQLITRATDYGFWRRQHLICHNHIVSDEEDDRDLIDKLEKEIPQVLGLLVKKCVEYLKEGRLKMPEKVKDAVNEYKTDMDIVDQWVKERCETGSEEFYTRGSELYEDFVNYAKRNKEYEMTNTLFGRNLTKKFKRKRIGSGNVYIGIRIRVGVEDISKKVKFENIKIDKENI